MIRASIRQRIAQSKEREERREGEITSLLFFGLLGIGALFMTWLGQDAPWKRVAFTASGVLWVAIALGLAFQRSWARLGAGLLWVSWVVIALVQQASEYSGPWRPVLYGAIAAAIVAGVVARVSRRERIAIGAIALVAALFALHAAAERSQPWHHALESATALATIAVVFGLHPASQPLRHGVAALCVATLCVDATVAAISHTPSEGFDGTPLLWLCYAGTAYELWRPGARERFEKGSWFADEEASVGEGSTRG